MAEPVCDQLIDNLKTLLLGIVGDGGTTYHHSTNSCVRAPGLHEGCLDSSLSDEATCLTLSPDDEDDQDLTFTHTRGLMRVDISAAHRFTPVGEASPIKTPIDPDRWKVQNRLVKDIKKRIRRDFDDRAENTKLGGLALRVHFPITERESELTVTEGWALVFIRAVIEYAYDDIAP